MKNLELNALGVQEMNARETRSTDGGLAWPAILGIATVAIYVYNNAGDFIDGVVEGFEAQQES